MPLPFFSSSMTGLANTWLCFFCYPDADIIIGTSAGSVDGAHLSSGFDLESLFTTHPTPVEQTKERKVEFDPAQLMEASRQAVAGAGSDPKAIRAHIGADALAVPSTPEAERRAIIETWLSVHTWPGQRLLIVAVDTEIGEEYVMNRTSGVPLVDAVSARCCIHNCFRADPRDLEARRPSALAGRALGRELATSVAALWSRTSSGRASPNFKYKWDS